MSQPLSEGKRLGRYKLIRRLATGGMAEVWLARATGIQGFAKDIVIKTILPHHADEPEFVRMFVNEALLAAGLNHPNVVQIFDLGRLGRSYFIAMEYITGRSLRQIKRAYHRKKSRVPPWIVLRAALSVCDALDYAHNKLSDDGEPLGIVHRDVTPENIMISFAGVTKVLDFGIAKASTAGTTTQAGRIKGKFAYLAPEQILGAGRPGEVDGRTDIYALGVVLYEMLTGVRPFRAGNEIGLLKLILHDDPPLPSEVNPGIPPPLCDIIMGALAKDPTKRYQSSLDVRADLEEFMASSRLLRSERDVAAHMRDLFQSKGKGAAKEPAEATPSQVRQRQEKKARERRERAKRARAKKGAAGREEAPPEPPKPAAKLVPPSNPEQLPQRAEGEDVDELAPDVDVTIDLSDVEVIPDELLESIQDAELGAEDAETIARAADDSEPEPKPKAKRSKSRRKAPKKTLESMPAGVAKAGSPAASKKVRRPPTPESSRAADGVPRFQTQGLAPPGETEDDDDELTHEDQERAEAVTAPPAGKKKGAPTADERDAAKRKAGKARKRLSSSAMVKGAAAAPLDPSVPSSKDLTGDKELTTGASGRGMTKPSAGVPPLEDSSGGFDLGIQVEAADADPAAAPEPGVPSPSSSEDSGPAVELPSPSSTESGSPADVELPSPASVEIASLPATDGDSSVPSSGDMPALSTGGGGPAASVELPTPESAEVPSPPAVELPQPASSGLPQPATTGASGGEMPALSPGLGEPALAAPDLPSPSSTELPDSAAGLPQPSTDARLSVPAADSGVTGHSLDSLLPTPATGNGPSPKPAAQSPAADEPVSSSELSSSAPQPTPWDRLISRSRSEPGADSDDLEGDSAELPPPAEPPSDPGFDGDDDLSDSQRGGPHAWDAFLERTRMGDISVEDVLGAMDPSPVGDEPAATEPEAVSSARPPGSSHMWDAVLAGARSERDDDEDSSPSPSERDAESSRRAVSEVFSSRRPRTERASRTSSSGDVFSSRRLSLSSEMRAAARFDEGLELLRGGERESARIAWEEAVELDPENRRYRTNLRMLRKMIDGEPD